MSWNDPDSEPPELLTFEDFMLLMLSTGWVEGAAQAEWYKFNEELGRPPYSDELEW